MRHIDHVHGGRQHVLAHQLPQRQRQRQRHAPAHTASGSDEPLGRHGAARPAHGVEEVLEVCLCLCLWGS